MKYTRSPPTSGNVLYALDVPESVAAAVASGRAQLQVTFGRYGADARVQFMEPGVSHILLGLERAADLLKHGSLPRNSFNEALLLNPVDGNADPVEELPEMNANPAPPWRPHARAKPKVHRSPSPAPSPMEIESSEESSDSDEASTADFARFKRALANSISASNKDLKLALEAAASEDSGLIAITRKTVAECHAAVKAGNLDRNRKNGILNIFPATSLVPEEFKRKRLEDLYTRAVVVANAITPGKMIGRIASDYRFKIDGANSINDWWMLATAEQRFLALTTAKSCSAPCDKKRLLLLPCPFQEPGTNEETY